VAHTSRQLTYRRQPLSADKLLLRFRQLFIGRL